MPTWCSGVQCMGAGNGNESSDHAHAPHSVFAKRYSVTRPRAAFCCWRLLVSVHNSQSGKQLLCTIYIALSSIHFIWHFFGKAYNSYFWLVELLWKLQVFSFWWWIFVTQATCTRQTLLPSLSLPYYSSSSCAECYIWYANNILFLFKMKTGQCLCLSWKVLVLN